MEHVLFAWIGNTDLRASRGEPKVGLGPIAQALDQRRFTHVVLVTNYDRDDEDRFVNWLSERTPAIVIKNHVKLTSPTDFREIYRSAVDAIQDMKNRLGPENFKATYHLSPGTPAMAAVWIILAKTSCPAELIESSQEKGVRTVSLPFEISADYLPEAVKPSDDEMVRLAQGLPPESPEFGFIIHRCKEMKKVIMQARRLAIHSVPVLIQGESGTGKELFARAIHTSSPRREKPFVAVNCGAIPPELVESEFFGHKKGSFTGAVSDRDGYFLTANEGTIFLDEIGELPLPAQVKLLRTIQEGKMLRVGSSKHEPVDVRIVAATNRNLIEDVVHGKFREDLFHRIAVGLLALPPLRDRRGDLNLLIDHILGIINHNSAGIPNWVHKNLSAGARNLMHQHPWPGNVRELYNTLSRAVILIADKTIETEDIREALFPISNSRKDEEKTLNRSLGNGFSLPDVLSEVARHYLKRAVEESRGNKTKMSTLLGLSNYQTVSNWLKKYGVDE